MKLRTFVLVALLAAVSVSAAIAAPPPGKGKPETTPSGKAPGKPAATGTGCRPQVTVVLKGTLTSVPASTLEMKVTGSNRWGRAWATAGTASVGVNADTTKVRGSGNKSLANLVPGSWVLVQARVCKAELASNAMPPLVAVSVVAHPAKT